MKPRAALAALVATITVFAWQTVSHMALPWHHVTVMVFKNPEVVEKMLVENANDPGMYMLPWADHNDEETMKKAMEQWDHGFSMFAAVRQMVSTRWSPASPNSSCRIYLETSSSRSCSVN